MRARFRQVGGSVMVAVPPVLLDRLHLGAGVEVDLSVEDDRLVVVPVMPRRIALADMIQASDFTLPAEAAERAWLDSPALGEELL